MNITYMYLLKKLNFTANQIKNIDIFIFKEYLSRILDENLLGFLIIIVILFYIIKKNYLCYTTNQDLFNLYYSLNFQVYFKFLYIFIEL